MRYMWRYNNRPSYNSSSRYSYSLRSDICHGNFPHQRLY
ncbi:hypothetical protein AYI69_g7449, partial [Smittium culicis]